MEKLNQVMLYVKSQDECVKFWVETLDFYKRSEVPLMEDYKMVEVSCKEDSETSLVLFDVEFIKKYSKDVTLGTPSLMFKTNDIDGLYEKIKKSGVKYGELVNMGDRRIFNFSDYEGNFFAVSN